MRRRKLPRLHRLSMSTGWLGPEDGWARAAASRPPVRLAATVPRLVAVDSSGWHLKSCVVQADLCHAAALEGLTLPEMLSGVLSSLLGEVAAVCGSPLVVSLIGPAAVAAVPPAGGPAVGAGCH